MNRTLNKYKQTQPNPSNVIQPDTTVYTFYHFRGLACTVDVSCDCAAALNKSSSLGVGMAKALICVLLIVLATLLYVTCTHCNRFAYHPLRLLFAMKGTSHYCSACVCFSFVHILETLLFRLVFFVFLLFVGQNRFMCH